MSQMHTYVDTAVFTSDGTEFSENKDKDLKYLLLNLKSIEFLLTDPFLVANIYLVTPF